MHGVTREGVPGAALHLANRFQAGELDVGQLDGLPPSLEVPSLLLGCGVLERFGDFGLDRLKKKDGRH